MTFVLGAWLTARRKNRISIALVIAAAGAAEVLARAFDLSWLFETLALPVACGLLQPLVIAFPPGQRFARVIDRFWPGYLHSTEIETRKAELREVAEAFASIVGEYRLGLANGRLETSLLLARAPAVKTEEQRLDHCAREFLALAGTAHPHLTAPLLKLLYREARRESRTAWASFREDPAALAALGKVLVDSGKLPASSAPAGTIERILRPHEEFLVDTVHDELVALERIWRVAERWGRFLGVENDLPVDGLTFAFVFDRIEATGGLPRRPKDVAELADTALPILRWIGEGSIEGKYPAIKEAERQVHLLIALAVFLTKVVPKEPAVERSVPHRQWVQDLCAELYARSDSYAVLLAYLDLREELKDKPAGRRPYVTIDQLVRDWRRHSAKRATGPDLAEEIEHIREQLGQWKFPPRLLPVTTPQRLAKVKKQYQDLLQLAEERAAILRTLRRLFERLTIGTVERFLEARGSDAYLLTFSTLHGNLAELIDALVDPDLRAQARDLGIALSETPYNFKHYTNNARIGLVPSGWTFEHFATALQGDLGRLLDNRGRLFADAPALAEIEVLVHRFNLSEDDYFEVRHERVRRHAVLEVRALLSETLPAEQMVALVEHDGTVNIVDAVLAGPIADLTDDEVPYTPAERQVLARCEPGLRSDLVRARGASSIQDLARRFAETGERQAGVATLVDLLIQQVPALAAERRAQAAECYVRTLAAVASVGRPPAVEAGGAGRLAA